MCCLGISPASLRRRGVKKANTTARHINLAASASFPTIHVLSLRLPWGFEGLGAWRESLLFDLLRPSCVFPFFLAGLFSEWIRFKGRLVTPSSTNSFWTDCTPCLSLKYLFRFLCSNMLKWCPELRQTALQVALLVSAKQVGRYHVALEKFLPGFLQRPKKTNVRPLGPAPFSIPGNRCVDRREKETRAGLQHCVICSYTMSAVHIPHLNERQLRYYPQ